MSGHDALVERITREVLARLRELEGGKPGTAPAPPAPAARAELPDRSPEDREARSADLKAYQRSYRPYDRPAEHAPSAKGVDSAEGFRHPNPADSEDRARAVDPSRRSPETVRRFVAAGASRIGSAPGGGSVPRDIARYIDHTLLKPDATDAEIEKLCAEAREYRFASVCVNPSFVKRCADLLRGSEALVCTVVGFPLGATTGAVKAFESRKAIREGAREVDMVINVGALKSGDYDLVQEDIEAVVEACHESGVLVKVIIEAALLTDEEKVAACLLAKKARADYVKTSTGFASGGATIRDVAIMRATVGPGMGVKAAGGIRTYMDAVGMIEAGATRIGASAGVRIVKESRGERPAGPVSKGPY